MAFFPLHRSYLKLKSNFIEKCSGQKYQRTALILDLINIRQTENPRQRIDHSNYKHYLLCPECFEKCLLPLGFLSEINNPLTDPKFTALKNIVGKKERMLVTSILNLPHNYFYPLTLYHTIQYFKREEDAFRKHCEKRRKCW